MRLFWALPWPDSQVLENAQLSLQQRGITARWVKPELAHLTLVFLGEVAESALAGIREAGASAVSQQSPFRLQSGSYGVFPRLSAARTLWWGFEENRELSALAHRLQQAMRPFAKLEQRPFQAHLTLASFRDPAHLPVLLAAPSFSWVAGKLILYRIHLGSGVFHEPLAELSFNGPIHASADIRGSGTGFSTN